MKYEMNGRYFYNYDYEDEIWYPVIGYSLYEVSNYCRVKNIQTQKMLRPQILEYSKPKTLHFMLYNNGKKKNSGIDYDSHFTLFLNSRLCRSRRYGKNRNLK